MLEALLDPVDACASRTPAVPLTGNYRPTGASPNEQVLAILRGIPEVECLLGAVVASWHSSLASLHSRRWHRVTYEKPLLITPLVDLTERPSEPSFWVHARDLSLAGISFCHPRPLASRKVIIQFPAEDLSAGVGILTMLRWCRFRRDGAYQSGGQFGRSAAPNAAEPLADLDDGCDQFRADRSTAIECFPAF